MEGANTRDTADVTIDQDQVKKFEEIIALLLAAGYFRARISTFSEFDKIVGGLSWLITSTNVDFDIDLFFQENAQIRKKIELGERIEEALVRMKCPYQLQSNQIRGLDTVKIFPVIQWLVKKVIEIREETGDLLRVFSESQFNKAHELPEDKAFQTRKSNALSYIAEVNERYKPRRRYKRPPGITSSSDEDSRVESVLIEYGYLQWASRGLEGEDDTSSAGSSGSGVPQQLKDREKAKKEKEDEERKRRQQKIDSVMKSMVATKEEAIDSVATKMVGSLVGYDAGIISEIATKYASERIELDDKQLKKAYGEEVHKRQKQKREEQIEKQQAKLQEIQAAHDSLSVQLEKLSTEHTKRVALNNRIVQEIEKLNAMETPENKDVLELLRSLIALNESLKQQEQAFREECKRQFEELKAKVASVKGESGQTDKDQLERTHEIDSAYDEEANRLNETRILAAKKNREIALVQRSIDELPSRGELLQYQQQFVELYEQMSAKFTETKKYFNTFNTLTNTRDFLQKEVSILNSIDENYKQALISQKNKEMMRDSLVKITKGVTESLAKIGASLQTAKTEKDQLNAQYLRQLEQEREFSAMTKEFQLQCAKNQELLAKLG